MSRYVLLCCQFLFGAAFAVSLWSKVHNRRAYADFAAAVPQLAPWAPARWAGSGVVLAEAAIVVLVAVPATAPMGLALAAALLVTFTVAIAGTIRRRRAVTCQCFGTSTTPVGPAHLIRNGVLLVCAIAGLLTGLAADPGPVVPEILAAAALTGLVAAAVVVLTDQIAELFRSTV